MREDLKFRIWHTKECEWIAIGNMADFHNDTSISLILQSDPNIVIQQFTGLNDVEGEEIYEGDFVELWTVVNQKAPEMRGFYEIIWGCAGFDLKCHKKAAGDIWFELHKDKCRDRLPLKGFNICKIIGNIYEDKNEIR